ncbi:hypothetical protein HY630_02200 [Candidatus Uhrbacteria bacterium]|nr:hypothetical protein [Candidatus Uhrbacteria bacterium]
MFDDVKDPEDMFAATDKVAPQVTSPTDVVNPPPVAMAPVAPAPRVPMPTGSEPKGGFPWKVIVLVVGILVVIGSAFFLSMKILGSRTPVTPEPPEREVEEVVEVEEEAPVVEEEVVEEEEESVVSRTDTDKDGLTDEEEAEFGTSARSEDTDSDGLFDPEEIRTWETDPLNPDTDGDGYLDGGEVSAGYNPNGDGPLREAPTESS